MKAANPSHALALVLVDEFARLGLPAALLSPGSRSAALAMALHDDGRIRLRVCLDERSAAFHALGVARATRRPAAVLTTSGTATANVHPAVVEADAARVPLLVLTADRPPELRDTGANQTIRQPGLFGRAVRWAADLGVAQDRPGAASSWRSIACQAWAAASGAGGPPGPVHLNLPFREPLVPAEVDARGTTEGPFDGPLDGRPDERPWTRAEPAPRPAAPTDVDDLGQRIATTQRGLVVAGDTDADPAGIVALAEAAGWPLLAEPLSGARSGPNAVSTYDALLSHAPFAAAHRPDLVVRVGRVALSRPLLAHLGTAGFHVLIDRDGAWLDPGRSTDRIVAADPAAACRAVAERLDGSGRTAWLDAWTSAEQAARTVLDGALDAEGAPTEPRAARDVAAAVPSGGTLVAASSMPVRDLDAFMRPRAGLRVVGNRGASGIDGFVSTSLGVALAGTGPTVALAGDLSLLHDRNGLLIDDRAGADLVLVVVDNDGWGIFSFLPQADFPASFERVFGTPHGIDVGRVAATHGCDHVLVHRPGDVADEVAAGLRDGGIRVVEVRTDRADNVALHRRLRGAVAAALDAAAG